MGIKDKILEQLKSGPKSLQELVKVTGAKEGVVKGQLTRLEKAGKVEKTEDGKYKLK
ncbi:MAG: ArsR family transcriptional regulator [Candidatus Korarchaeum sp.]